MYNNIKHGCLTNLIRVCTTIKTDCTLGALNLTQRGCSMTDCIQVAAHPCLPLLWHSCMPNRISYQQMEDRPQVPWVGMPCLREQNQVPAYSRLTNHLPKTHREIEDGSPMSLDLTDPAVSANMKYHHESMILVLISHTE